jgi:hypothetical protein
MMAFEIQPNLRQRDKSGRTRLSREQEEMTFPIPTFVEGLKSANVEERRSAFSRLSHERAVLIADLLRIIDEWRASKHDSMEFEGTEHYAFLSLGAIRAAEAVQTLVKCIKIPHSGAKLASLTEILPLDEYFPALRALIAIGEPSIAPLLDVVASSAHDELSTQLAVMGMIRIEGRDTCAYRLQDLFNQVVSGEKVGDEHNVEKALSFVRIPTIVTMLQSEPKI